MANPEVPFGKLVSHVSHRWRSIALATPNLWTRIRYKELLYPAKTSTVEMVTTYLSRSQSAPLDIYVEARNMPLPSVMNQSISNHIGHFRRLELRIPYAVDDGKNLRQLFETAFQQAVPLLRSFRWVCVISQFPGPMFSCGAPNLTIVDLFGIPFDCIRDSCLPAFTSVTHLRLAGSELFNQHTIVDYRAFREVLMGFPALVHLELALFAMAPLEQISHIVLPTLQFLHVVGSSWSLNGIITNFRSVSLTSLSMSGWDYDFEGAILDPSNLVLSPFPSLRHLILQHGVSYAIREFTSLAKTFPNIDRLTCGVGPDHLAPTRGYGPTPEPQEDVEDIFNALIKAADDGAPWSALNTIAVSALSKPVNASVLCALVRRLRNARCPLRTLLIPTASVSREDMAELRKVIDVEDFQDGLPMLIKDMF
ncbi:hypothetical protein FIBSPDRAFT_992143 [Athelia psychrophila]|uniref:F-box domain-containing protein n=1 Tax=Athelia psychrophila TaxID=1759441 RepID=A0A166S967_9AGAM|nr:hypothetical protein FIBSPDRAFT_992143 [Fibularhizoctonia sp. CBS 109695]